MEYGRYRCGIRETAGLRGSVSSVCRAGGFLANLLRPPTSLDGSDRVERGPTLIPGGVATAIATADSVSGPGNRRPSIRPFRRHRDQACCVVLECGPERCDTSGRRRACNQPPGMQAPNNSNNTETTSRVWTGRRSRTDPWHHRPDTAISKGLRIAVKQRAEVR